MSPQTNCVDITNVTFLRASPGGATPLTLPDGRVIDPCGLALALANLSARQVKALGLRTSGIYGPPGSTSSRSVAPQSCLESKLRARLSMLGSTLYKLTWKAWVTPSGVSRFRLRASVRRKSETECTGWPTPTTRDWKDGAECLNVPVNSLLGSTVWAAGWPTCTANDAEKRGNVAWREGKPNGLNATAAITGPARLTASGQMRTGSDAAMESGGQLNPAHSRWLMSYPPEWDACAVTAMPLSRRKRQSL